MLFEAASPRLPYGGRTTDKRYVHVADMTASSLAIVIGDATSVRVTRVGAMNSRRRREARFVVTDAKAVASIREALGIVPESLSHRVRLMTPGVLELHFFRGHTLVASVAYLPPDRIRWSGWDSDARPYEPAHVKAWLAEHRWAPDGG